VAILDGGKGRPRGHRPQVQGRHPATSKLPLLPQASRPAPPDWKAGASTEKRGDGPQGLLPRTEARGLHHIKNNQAGSCDEEGALNTRK
jgi:hypothetical protein